MIGEISKQVCLGILQLGITFQKKIKICTILIVM